MPRNGDGSGDNGPIDGHEIIHGTSGDTTLQHTKHVAPMPDLEEGEALPGMNASGGAAAPLNDASEEFGTNAPRNEQFGDDETSTSTSTSGNAKAGTSSSNTSKSSSSGQQSSGKSSSGGNSKSGHDNHDKNDLENVSREKAKRYVNMDEEDVQHAGTPNSKNDTERSSQRAPKDAGPKEDIEMLHGKADWDENNRSKQSNGSGSKSSSGSGNGGHNSSDNKGASGKGGNESKHHGEDPMRHNAEKFVNLDD